MSTKNDEPAGPDDTASTASSGEEAARKGTGPDEGTSPRDRLRGWFTGRLPAGWFTAAPVIEADREEITVIGSLPDPEVAADASEAERAAAAEGRIRRFREETRARRVEIAREAEHRFRRKVSWGVTCAGRTEMFTTLSAAGVTRWPGACAWSASTRIPGWPRCGPRCGGSRKCDLTGPAADRAGDIVGELRFTLICKIRHQWSIPKR